MYWLTFAGLISVFIYYAYAARALSGGSAITQHWPFGHNSRRYVHLPMENHVSIEISARHIIIIINILMPRYIWTI